MVLLAHTRYFVSGCLVIIDTRLVGEDFEVCVIAQWEGATADARRGADQRVPDTAGAVESLETASESGWRRESGRWRRRFTSGRIVLRQ